MTDLRRDLPAKGTDWDTLRERLVALGARDADWRHARTAVYVFNAGEDVLRVAKDAYALYQSENALGPMAFPSLKQMEEEVVGTGLALLHAPAEARGSMTSGGTESILLAVKAARDRARAERGVTDPEMVLPVSAHAAFHKAAHYFGVRMRMIPVDAGWRADLDAAAAAVNEHTALVVGSAPQYPQGVVDPIPELAALAASVGASFHTDACMGGFVLPFLEALGEPVPPWDFRVEGVTTISADIHKLGYAPKGVSVLLHRDKTLRAYQTFVLTDWMGGFYASPGMQGTRPAPPMACAWAVMHHLGRDGYLDKTRHMLNARNRMVAGIRSVPELVVLGEPEANIVTFAAVPGTDGAPAIDVFALGDALAAKGWYHDRQSPPDSLHASISAANAPVMDEWVTDLRVAVAEVTGRRAENRSTDYSTLD
jgi:sphinganine-1-phosphate aldolase